MLKRNPRRLLLHLLLRYQGHKLSHVCSKQSLFCSQGGKSCFSCGKCGFDHIIGVLGANKASFKG